MIPLLLEGFESALLPCSLVVLVPGAAVGLASRQESTPGLLGFAAAMIVFAWLRFAGHVEAFDRATIAGLLAVGLVMIVLPVVRRLDVVSGLGGFLVGVAASALWEPCVGAQFGSLLDDLPTRGPTGFALTAVYLVGVGAPIIAAGAVLHLIPDPVTLPARPLMLLIGGGTLAVLSLGVAAGVHDELIGRLVDLSA